MFQQTGTSTITVCRTKSTIRQTINQANMLNSVQK